MNDPITAFIRDLRHRLGWHRIFARRALREVRDHLEDAAAALEVEGTQTREEARRHAVQRYGSVETTARSILQSERLQTMHWMTDRSTLKMCLPLAPVLLLMTLGVLTYNADLPFLTNLAGPLHLLHEKHTWVKIFLTTVLPGVAVLMAFGTSMRIDRPAREGGWQMSLVVPEPARLFYRLGVACLVNVAAFIYY